MSDNDDGEILANLKRLWERVRALERRVSEELDDDVQGLDQRVDAVEGHVNELRRDSATIHSELSALSSRIDRLTSTMSSVSLMMTAIDTSTARLSSAFEDFAEEMRSQNAQEDAMHASIVDALRIIGKPS
jgi:chromosome segregation ATPase